VLAARTNSEERRRFEPWKTQPGTARRAARPDRLPPVQIRSLALRQYPKSKTTSSWTPPLLYYHIYRN